MSVALPLPTNTQTRTQHVRLCIWKGSWPRTSQDSNPKLHPHGSPHYERNMFAILLMTDSTGLAERVHDCSWLQFWACVTSIPADDLRRVQIAWHGTSAWCRPLPAISFQDIGPYTAHCTLHAQSKPSADVELKSTNAIRLPHPSTVSATPGLGEVV